MTLPRNLVPRNSANSSLTTALGDFVSVKNRRILPPGLKRRIESAMVRNEAEIQLFRWEC